MPLGLPRENSRDPLDTPAGSGPLDEDELRALDAHWRAANYLAVGQIYLMSNPLLTEPLAPEHIKPRLLGHWGTSPGLNLVHTHLNRVVKSRDLDVICVWGPGHGGPAVVANSWLEGSCTDTYPDITRDAAGMARLFRQFSFPGGVPSHVAPETPGSIHEGGELGYSLAHAYGAAFDNPGLLVACVIGDGEAETGPLAASWHSNKFLDPVRDGAVLPILHLNGYKIANPTVLARIPEPELDSLLRGYGHEPLHVTGDDPHAVHRAMARAMDEALDRIAAFQHTARTDGAAERPRWPMIVLRTPKGWTGPAEVDGVPVEGTWRAHQVPLPAVRENPDHLRQLEQWLRSYRPGELFDEHGRPRDQVLACVPDGTRRLGANPRTNGGLLLRDLPLPPPERFAVPVDKPGATTHEPTRVLGDLLARVMADTGERRDFRLVGPDETASNRLQAVYDASGKAWEAQVLPTDEHLERGGRVLEILSEHTCQGWLEGYLLTGRHGLFSCYETFVHIVDSMANQHIKWLRVARRLPWRRPIASLNYLLTSHVWRQDNNGFSHQDPGFVDHVLNKSPEVVRVYYPPDANTLLSVADHVLRSRDYVNVVVAGKQPCFDWLSMDQARSHCARGAGIWEWVGTESDLGEPDVVLACAGDVPTLEGLAAASLLRRHLPDLAVRVVDVVDIARLLPAEEHPHGMADSEYDALFTPDKPVVFAYHGYPWLIHRLAYRRAGRSCRATGRPPTPRSSTGPASRTTTRRRCTRPPPTAGRTASPSTTWRTSRRTSGTRRPRGYG
ncbi:phosphoketolase [Streptomyces sp. NPDC088350]|uniref:phosphoketolase family protein n=1 Tax=Streptomyces sp. NPDC088350 TaxID=3365854 RepID=UPI0038071F73